MSLQKGLKKYLTGNAETSANKMYYECYTYSRKMYEQRIFKYLTRKLLLTRTNFCNYLIGNLVATSFLKD